ncbi:hypothetical protein QNI16_27130 [Cytophagaceae bacterium YF14B1]|uniref:Lipoprotein n=1 Tax=Xanthocytophaga flava TaxID=3048013 RepID=A0AAE3U9Z8_9BACT|nr:hypothetical protein [Xanthocytophaga flavus]MDJ1484202.1 hypothetical protein [Xanthocytophaga flavus]
MFLIITFLFVLSCSSDQEQNPPFISTGGGFSVSLENVPNNNMMQLKDKIGDTLQMGFSYLIEEFDKYALFTISNDSTRSLFIWSHDNFFLYNVSQIHEKGTPKSETMYLTGYFTTPIKKKASLCEIKPKTSKTFYLPYCTTYRRFGKKTRFKVDMVAFNKYYTFDSINTYQSHNLSIALSIDSLKKAHIQNRDISIH